MRTIHWHVENGLNGCDRSGTFEVEDDATDEQIDEAVRDEVFNYVGWSWREKDKDE